MNNPALHNTPKIHYCQQDRIAGRDAFDTNGLVMVVMWIGLKITSSSDDQTLSPMFWSSSCWAQLRKTPPHTPGGGIKWLVSTQLSPCPSSSSSFKVCVSNVLLAMEPCDRKSPCHVHKQPYPECYAQTGSASEEEKGRWNTEIGVG